ncbi:MAG: hypothetical protein APF81_22405 [Desulfosporosinus sp. BRH_c37]|nr:MAG: hypothetical protein APF81_22405 [Desulfosporosinus sp. BRH_c37]
MILKNVFLSFIVEGDLSCQVGACKIRCPMVNILPSVSWDHDGVNKEKMIKVGVEVTYRWRVDAPGIRSANFGGGVREGTAPYGLQGGKDAALNVLYIKKASGEVITVDAETFYNLETGDIFEIYETGGGGFGNPLERPTDKVAKDVRDGLVSSPTLA